MSSLILVSKAFDPNQHLKFKEFYCKKKKNKNRPVSKSAYIYESQSIKTFSRIYINISRCLVTNQKY